ncbi:MAG: hypothetical protein B7Y90_10725 [Alphaproteobacteria bacterium 32-64-14]|nr:MAG: hypothetical protein B7Y90_10725 [Alphaproteobacteria bacterium 32-64-14]
MQYRLSVIVPTFNRTEQLATALASIRAVEGSDLSIEIIVGDNGNCPTTSTIAAEYGARYVAVGRRGASAARNAAMAVATGDYIGFLDDDDAWLPGHVRGHLNLLDERPEFDGVMGQVRCCNTSLVPLGWPDGPATHPGSGDDLIRRMLSGFFPQIGTVIVRASVRETSGDFDPELIGGEDLDWLLRLANRHALGFVQVPCILYSLRPIGEYDALQKSRVGYDRKVFRRHAHKMWRIWRSPGEYMRAYSGTLMNFYRYFCDAALLRAMRGERRKALGAIWHALGVFPFRGLKHLVVKSPLRRALTLSLFSWGAPHIIPLPIWLAVLHI